MTPSRNAASRLVAHLFTVALLVVSLVGVATVHSGSAQAYPDPSPTGQLTAFELTPGGLHVAGWARDPDTTASIRVAVSSDSSTFNPLVANLPVSGGNYGFDHTYLRPAGTHKICVTALNVGAGANRLLGCKTMTFGSNPLGSLGMIKQVPNAVRFTGWALDPDTTSPIYVDVQVDHQMFLRMTADRLRDDVAHSYPYYGGAHGFDETRYIPQGTHLVCLYAINQLAGTNRQLACRTVTLNYEPSGAINTLRQTPGGFRIAGWALDPDTTSPIQVHIYLDGHLVLSVPADASSPVVPTSVAAAGADHGYAQTISAPAGTHRVCVSGVNALKGPVAEQTLACRTIKLDFAPFGAFESAKRPGALTTITVTGWAADPDTSDPIHVQVTVDGALVTDAVANLYRPDVAKAQHIGTLHGYRALAHANDREHKVCVYGINAGFGTVNGLLGCRIVNAKHPVAPAAPRVHARAGYGSAKVSWTPRGDGGAPPSKFTIRTGKKVKTVSGSARHVVIGGLKPGRRYDFTVRATNVAGTSRPGRSNVIKTPKGPPPQTTPAPVATSRYIRNINGSSSDITKMRAEGAADAARNPAGHRYLVLLDIGGQGNYGGKSGVVLSATSHFVSNAALVKALNAYVDGYRSKQRLGAPVTIAIGANNDMTVNSSTGAIWAHQVVNPVAAHAAGHAGMTVAGANDIEPGFRADAAHTRAWLSGYLHATSRKFVFNGSADGCNWSTVRGHCNNGWTAADMYWLSGGASPSRIVSLPQIYNHTMAQQWKYISLTGVVGKHPRVKFGGPLTEWTACQQAGSCGSLGGHTAWKTLWSAIRSDARSSQGSLPYSTDLRIN